jgi:hypothetical protein
MYLETLFPDELQYQEEVLPALEWGVKLGHEITLNHRSVYNYKQTILVS